MSDFDVLVLKQLREAGATGLGIEQLYGAQTPYWHEHLQEQLVSLFRQGLVFVSQVERTSDGFVPNSKATWTLVRQPRFYGYDTRWGVYPIAQYDFAPLTVTLDATLFSWISNPLHCCIS